MIFGLLRAFFGRDGPGESRTGDALPTTAMDQQIDAAPLTRRPSYDPFVAHDRVTVDPAQMGGVPCIRGTRVTVSMVLGQLAAGRTVDEVLADYPYLERPDVFAALEFAAAIVNEREVPIARPA